jgi:hypothetical protein
MSNELPHSPMSTDKSIKNIEQSLSDQKLLITNLQEKLDKESENKQHLGKIILYLIYRISDP